VYVHRLCAQDVKYTLSSLSGHPLCGQNMFSPDNGDLVRPQSSLSGQKAVFVRITRSPDNGDGVFTNDNKRVC